MSGITFHGEGGTVENRYGISNYSRSSNEQARATNIAIITLVGVLALTAVVMGSLILSGRFGPCRDVGNQWISSKASAVLISSQHSGLSIIALTHNGLGIGGIMLLYMGVGGIAILGLSSCIAFSHRDPPKYSRSHSSTATFAALGTDCRLNAEATESLG